MLLVNRRYFNDIINSCKYGYGDSQHTYTDYRQLLLSLKLDHISSIDAKVLVTSTILTVLLTEEGITLKEEDMLVMMK